MLLQPEKMGDDQRSTMEKLCQLFPQIEKAKELAQAFTRMVRERTATEFSEWLRSAEQSRLQEFVSFARGLGEDYEAVVNALRYEWSIGQYTTVTTMNRVGGRLIRVKSAHPDAEQDSASYRTVYYLSFPDCRIYVDFPVMPRSTLYTSALINH